MLLQHSMPTLQTLVLSIELMSRLLWFSFGLRVAGCQHPKPPTLNAPSHASHGKTTPAFTSRFVDRHLRRRSSSDSMCLEGHLLRLGRHSVILTRALLLTPSLKPKSATALIRRVRVPQPYREAP